MTALSRRRFLTVAAGFALAGWAAPARAARFRGQAMGAAATLLLDHPEADRLAALVWAEIDRLEEIFSLHRPGSALRRLNAAGTLDAPPFELLECLGLAGAVHAATGGAFDPTVQPLWAAHARAWAGGIPPDPQTIAAARALTGWEGVSLSPGRIAFARPGMALTLNGIAQGFVADRVVRLLRAEGLRDALVDTGEIAALGRTPGGEDWPVQVADGPALRLRDRSVATSAPLGTAFDAAGTAGHILDPRTGRPGAAWTRVSVTAPSAALADALSTAFCLMDRPRIAAALAAMPGARLAALA